MRAKLTAIIGMAIGTGCAGAPTEGVGTTTAPLSGTAQELLHEPNGNIATAHPDSYVYFMTWDGSFWCGGLYNTTFLQSPGCDWSRSQQSPVMQYKAWDGSNWTAKLTVDGMFQYWPGNDTSQTHTANVLNYKAGTGANANWTMRLPDRLLHAPNGDFTQAHPDFYAAYLAPDGTQWCARLYKSKFVIAQNCSWAQAQLTDRITYKTWGGASWTAKVNSGVFDHTPNDGSNPGHSSSILDYLGWDQSQWTMKVSFNLPPGSWTQSCLTTNVTYDGVTLGTACYSGQASYWPGASLDISKCVSSDISNIMGVLSCYQTGNIPSGTYLNSCVWPSMNGVVLTATCRPRSGPYWHTSSLNITTCAPGSIANADGTLTCGTPAPPPPPPGGGSCTTTAQVTVQTCYNLDGSASSVYAPGSTTETGCGSSASDATNYALVGLNEAGFPMSDSPAAGYCTYTVQTYPGCYCGN